MIRCRRLIPFTAILFLSVYVFASAALLLLNLRLENKASTSSASQQPLENNTDTHDEYIFIGIKTAETGAHGERLPEIKKTWLKDALKSDKIQIKFFTHVQANHTDSSLMVTTKCKTRELACKTGQVFAYYLNHSKASWFCSFDDDNYVNIARLIQVLQDYENAPSKDKDWYIGKRIQVKLRAATVTIRFGTGGAGYCLNRKLVVRGSHHYSALETVRHTDDVAVGYVTEHKLGVEITSNPLFHSHLERTIRRKFSRAEDIDPQVSFGHDNKNAYQFPYDDLPNTPILFTKEDDPMGFRSLWCYLHRNDDGTDEKDSKDCMPTDAGIQQNESNSSITF